MQLNFWTILFIAIACMFFGYFFGLFEGRGQGYRKRKKEEGQEKAGEEPTAPLPAPPPAPVVKDDPGLLRLKEENGQFRVDLDGERLRVDSLSVDQRKRLIELITRFRPWVEGGRQPAGSAPAPFSTPPTTPPSARVPPAGTMSIGPSASPATPSRTAPVVRKEEPAAPTTMVGQIDAILQERMLNTPLAERGIRLEEAADGSVSVRVGLSRYPGVGEVPDPEVQTAIRAAIAEWERRFTPGL